MSEKFMDGQTEGRKAWRKKTCMNSEWSMSRKDSAKHDTKFISHAIRYKSKEIKQNKKLCLNRKKSKETKHEKTNFLIK